MSNAGQGEWFADSDGQWTWRQPDGSCWRQGDDGAWHELAVETASVPFSEEPVAAGTEAAASIPHFEVPHFGFQQVATGTISDPAPSPDLSASPQYVGPPHPGPPPQLNAPLPFSGGGQLGEITFPHAAAPALPKAETSAMAVWALILSLLPPLCYVNSVFGVVLGLEAGHHIKHSHGALRGKTPARLAIAFGMIWLATAPFIIAAVGSNVTNLINAGKMTVQDTTAKTALSAALSEGADNVFKVSHTYATIGISNLPNIPLVHFSATCGNGAICLASGNGFGYSYIQMCEQTGSDHAWIVSQASGASAWYGEASGSCPMMGNPGSPVGQPAQAAAWRQGGFPPPTLDVTLFGHHYHVKL